jgi:SAM-dependent methyltransferase
MDETTYVFGGTVDDRQRLEYQFSLLRDDFNRWFDEALRLAGRSTDPADADWSVLDLGCGEGQYSREIARRYPAATVVGVDVNQTSVAAASRAGSGVRFLVHDAAQPLPAGVAPDGGFDVVVSWIVLPYMADKAGVARNLAAALKPGGALVVATLPDEPIIVDHPSAESLRPFGRELFERIGMAGLEDGVDGLLTDAGFEQVRTVSLTYPMSARWYRYFLMGLVVARPAMVELFKLMGGAEYDARFAALAEAPVEEQHGSVRFLVTLARRPR